MKKGFCLRRYFIIAFIILLGAGIVALGLLNYEKTQKNDKLNNELDLIEAEQKALWDCIVKCNKKKADNAECWCIQATKNIKVY